MTTADIESHMRALYDIEISDSIISRIADKPLSIVKEWQDRSLEDICAVVLLSKSGDLFQVFRNGPLFDICDQCHWRD